MKFTIAALILLLSACSTKVPVKQTWPAAPPELTVPCPDLAQLAPTDTAITDLLRVVVKNYSTYWECAARVDGWQDWHRSQREIFEKVNKK